ncbi:hypothetical protein FE236_09000 [Mariprofundus erugo]|nr:hypothetical protein FE236_09000 [Mariprofundus erugo]
MIHGPATDKEEVEMKRIITGIIGLIMLIPSGAYAGLNDGLTGLWTFDEGLGVIANDVSGNNNNGTINGGVSFVGGHDGSGTALGFDGSTGFVEIQDSASLSSTATTDQITISYWVNPRSLTGDLISKRSAANVGGFVIEADGSTVKHFLFMNNVSGSNNSAWPYVSSAYPLNTWTHVAITYKDGAGLKLFINGVLTQTLPVNGNLNAVPSVLRMGMDSEATNARFFDGALDEVKIFHRALDDCEIARLAGDKGQCLTAAIQSESSPSRQYSLIDPELQQDIVADNIYSPAQLGEAWTADGHMLRRTNYLIAEYSLEQNRIVYGTPVYTLIALHSVPGLDLGYGMTNGTDGYIYGNSPFGLYRIDPISWTATRVAPNGYYYGIGTLPDGRIVNEASGGNLVFAYDPATNIQSLFHNPGTFIDDLTTTDTGHVILAALSAAQVRVIDSHGAFVNAGRINGYTGSGRPDGMAYGDGSIYSANTDGSISRTDFSGPDFTGRATETIVAAGGFYGDLSSVGPDGSFYISTNGLRYDNGTTAGGWGVVRISKAGGFSTPPGVPTNQPPVADAGTPQVIECSGSGTAHTTLDGSGSSDPDVADILSYSWEWAGGTASGINPVASFPLGTTLVTLTVNDGNGHTSTATTTVTVQDTTPPTVNAGNDVTLEATSIAGADYQVASQISASDRCCDLTTTIFPLGPYPLGATEVTVTATDCSNNSSSDRMIVTVVDRTPPQLTLPADVHIEANGLLSTVAIGMATATDIFPVTISSDAPTVYPLGTTAVTWTATDDNGNKTTGIQHVYVVDTTPPVVTAALIRLSGEEDDATFRVEFSATDIVDANPTITATLNGTVVTQGQIVKLERSKKERVEMEHGILEISGITFNLTVSATDASGNTGSAAAAFSFPTGKSFESDRNHEEKQATAHGNHDHTEKQGRSSENKKESSRR